MKLVRDFERRLEQLVDGMAGRVFRGKLHPVELAARLVREADLSIEESPAGPSAANVYSLRVNPRDLDGEIPSGLVQELEDVLDSTAADRGWRLNGPTRVSLQPDAEVSPGTLDCRVDRTPGTRPPWGVLTADNGTRYPIRHNRCVIGRAEDSDVAVGHPGVSRTHALLWRESGDTWIVDLQSANGTTVNGASSQTPVNLTPGSVVIFGPLAFTFRLV